AMLLYRTTQHVPLLIHVPEGKEKRVAGIVRHIDIVPTILDLLEIKAPAGIQGASLIDIMNGKEKSQRIAFSESIYPEAHYGWSPLQSVMKDHYQYIEAPHPELYDWKTDSGETHNLIQEKASIAK